MKLIDSVLLGSHSPVLGGFRGGESLVSRGLMLRSF